MKRQSLQRHKLCFLSSQADGGVRVDEVCRKMRISEATYYKVKKKFGGLGVTELRRLRQLEEENNRLKQIVADLTLDNPMLQEVLKKCGKLRQLKGVAEKLTEDYRMLAKRSLCSGLYAPVRLVLQVHTEEKTDR